MSDRWNKVPSIEQLRAMDTSGYPRAGTIQLCLLCAKPFLMLRYSGYPDQVCPECFETYRDCASVLCRICQVVVGKVRPEVLASGFYVRPRSVLHIDFCPVCRPPPEDIEVGDVACISHVIEIREYENRMGGPRKIIIPMGRQ